MVVGYTPDNRTYFEEVGAGCKILGCTLEEEAGRAADIAGTFEAACFGKDWQTCSSALFEGELQSFLRCQG